MLKRCEEFKNMAVADGNDGLFEFASDCEDEIRRLESNDRLMHKTNCKLSMELDVLQTTIRTFLHDLDAHEAQVSPSEIRMNSGMWLQVQAFRNLLEGV